MRKINKVVLLIVTHLLCIILGYCIAMIRPNTTEPNIPSEQTQEVTESKAVIPPEQTEPSAVTEENVLVTENTQAPTSTEPGPTYSQPVTTQPATTEPAPPPTDVPDIDVGPNGTPIL